VPPGRVRLVLTTGGAGRTAGPQRDVDVHDGRTTRVEFDLREVRVSGRVTRSGTPAAGLRVSVSPDGPLGLGPLALAPMAAAGPASGTAVTREDGSYELVVEQPGRVRIMVESPDGSLRLPPR